jgi:DNA-binding transcriptional regulator YiaG
MEKKFAELNYYEMLNVKPDAAFFEIRHAYNAAMQMYQADSMISHSFFSHEERKQILSFVEKAYLTLINEKERQSYDNELIRQGVLTATKWKVSPKKPVCIFDINHNQGKKSILKSNDELREKIAQSKCVAELIAQSEISGANLKEIRNKLDVSIEHIAQVTKISSYYIKCIEEGNISRLPAPVFLKGFIKAYLKSLCLEPVDDICNKYMSILTRVEKK